MLNLLSTANTKKPLSNLLAVALLMVATVTGMMIYQIHGLNHYQNNDNQLDSKEAYERNYKQYQTMPMPSIIAMKTEVDIFAEQQMYHINGDYQLKNTTNKVINSIFVTVANPLQTLAIEGAKVTLHDTIWNAYLFELQQPLAPGAELSMTFSLQHTSTAFSIAQNNVANGSFIEHGKFEPLMGYVEQLEITDEFERKNRGLPIDNKSSISPPFSNKELLISEKRLFEAIVSTDADQVAVTSGQLIKQWHKDGRNYFHYKTQPTVYPPNLAYFSGRYAQKSVDHKGLIIEMYYKPAHKRNIDEMIRSVKASYDYLSSNFGAYPFNSIRIIEVPAYHPFGGKASAGVIAMTERLYTQNYTDGAAINNVARNTIHEFAHQWWGEKLVPKALPGEGVLIESMAKYFEVVILEKLISKTMARQLTKYNQRRYFSGRAYANKTEVGLTSSQEQNYLNYGKGPVNLLALRELIGETKLNTALKNLIDTHKQGMTATIKDFMDALYIVTDAKQHELINDWFNNVIVYDLSVDNAQIEPLANGQYLVEFDVKAARFAANAKGEYLPITIDEPIQIALMANDQQKLVQVPIYLQQHQITQAVSRIKLIVNHKAQYVVIDPDFTRLDQHLADNAVTLKHTSSIN